MTGKITYFTIKDFAEKGVFDDSSSKCIINDAVFRKSDTFADFEIKKALDTCNKYNNFGVDTLVVKKDNELTIWIEEEFSTSNETNNSQENLNHSPSTQPQTNQSLPTKTVIKKYRGREYEEIVVDWAAVQQTNQHSSHRKYRGQYID